MLSDKAYTPLLLEYDGDDPNIRSLVRMTIPYSPKASVDLKVISRTNDYWKHVSVASWARRLWRSALQHGEILDLTYPLGIQSGLVVEFATESGMPRERDVVARPVLSTSPFAIWVLHRNLYLISRILHSATDGATGKEVSVEETDWDRRSGDVTDHVVDYQYLEEEVSRCIMDLIEKSNDVLAAFKRDDRSQISKAIRDYIAVIIDHLKDSGISSWIACRCAVVIVENKSGTWRHVRDRNIDELSELGELLDGFYGNHGSSPALRHLPLRWRYGIPVSLRLCKGGALVPLSSAISDMILGRLRRELQIKYSWIDRIPLPTVVVKPLVEACQHHLRKLLRFIGDRGLVGVIGEGRLRVQHVRRILKICRETDDKDVLSGAGAVLVQASLERIATPDVIAKILSAAPSSPLLHYMLGAAGYFGRKLTGNAESERVPLSLKVAHLILDRAQEFPSRVVIQAATIVSEKEPSENVPLFERHPDLAE